MNYMTQKCSIAYAYACSVMSNSSEIPRTVAHQAPLSMGFPRQKYWSRLPFHCYISLYELIHLIVTKPKWHR